MKFFILSLICVPQILALAIPMTINQALGLDGIGPVQIENKLAKRQPFWFPEYLIWKAGTMIYDAIHDTPPPPPGANADKPAGDPGSYNKKLKIRNSELSDWVVAIHRALKEDPTLPGGERQIEEILIKHPDILPQGWKSLDIPADLAIPPINSGQTKAAHD